MELSILGAVAFTCLTAQACLTLSQPSPGMDHEASVLRPLHPIKSPLLQMPKRGHMRALTADDCPAEIATLIEQCLEDEPWKRPSAKQIFDVIKVSAIWGPRLSFTLTGG